MNEKNNNKLIYAILVILLIIIVIIGYMLYIINSKINNIENTVLSSSETTTVETDQNSQENKSSLNSITNNTSENSQENKSITEITSQCQKKYEEYEKYTNELCCGDSLKLLKDLNLSSEIPSDDKYKIVEYDNYERFYNTDIKYSDFKNAMLKYMSESLFENEYDNTYIKNVNGYLQIYANIVGSYLSRNFTKFELTDTSSNFYTFNVSYTSKAEDGSPSQTINGKIVFEKINEDYIVSSCKF